MALKSTGVVKVTRLARLPSPSSAAQISDSTPPPSRPA